MARCAPSLAARDGRGVPERSLAACDVPRGGCLATVLGPTFARVALQCHAGRQRTGPRADGTEQCARKAHARMCARAHHQPSRVTARPTPLARVRSSVIAEGWCTADGWCGMESGSKTMIYAMPLCHGGACNVVDFAAHSGEHASHRAVRGTHGEWALPPPLCSRLTVLQLAGASRHSQPQVLAAAPSHRNEYTFTLHRLRT